MSRYTPGNVPTDPASLAVFLRQEIEKIAQAIDAPVDQIDLKTLYAPPAKYRNGAIVKADGTTWNPGSGAGVYCYYGSAWHFLG